MEDYTPLYWKRKERKSRDFFIFLGKKRSPIGGNLPEKGGEGASPSLKRGGIKRLEWGGGRKRGGLSLDHFPRGEGRKEN